MKMFLPLGEHLAAMLGPLEALQSQASAATEMTKATYAEEPEDGVSYLDVKQQLLGHYNLALVLYCRLKLRRYRVEPEEEAAEVESLEEEPLLRQLFMLRGVLEKLRPLDKKLRFQLDRLLQLPAASEAAVPGPATVDGNGDRTGGDADMEGGDVDAAALQFRPRPELLTAHGEEPNAEETTDPAARAYRPPKLVSTSFDGLDSAERKAQKAADKARRRLDQSEMMASLREELGDGPEMVDANLFSSGAAGGVQSSKAMQLRREDQERRAWEEARFMRSNVSKKEKLRRQQQQKTVTGADSLADFTANADALSAHFADADKRSKSAARRQAGAGTLGGKRPARSRGALEESIGALAKGGAAYDQRASNKKRRKRL